MKRVPRGRLSEDAYSEIRKRIIFEDLAGGQVINEMALIRELKLGRTPVREAVQRLAREGLLKVFPRKGILVSELSVDTLRQVFEARSPCEAQVARCAALRAEPSDIERMEEALSEVDGLVDEKQFRRLVEADERFHLSLADAAKNPLLRGIVAMLYGLGIRFWYITLPQRLPQDIKKEMALHREVLKSVKARDPDKATEAMLMAIGGFPDRVADVLRGDLHGFPVTSKSNE